MNLSRFTPEVSGTPEAVRPERWPSWWWSRLELSSNTHRSFGHDAPLTRGWLHRAAALVWPLLVVRLMLLAEPGQARFSIAAFGVGMQAMFSASTLTHLRRWDVWTTEVMFRLDHSGIFMAIGGSMTPMALLALNGWMSVTVLLAAWGVMILGIVIAMYPAATPVGFGNTSFITFGAMIVPFLPVAFSRIGLGGVLLMALGGAFYIVGAVMLAFQKPALSPKYFGYHEVWHLNVVFGVLTHYVMFERYFLPLAVKT